MSSRQLRRLRRKDDLGILSQEHLASSTESSSESDVDRDQDYHTGFGGGGGFLDDAAAATVFDALADTDSDEEQNDQWKKPETPPAAEKPRSAGQDEAGGSGGPARKPERPSATKRTTHEGVDLDALAQAIEEGDPLPVPAKRPSRATIDETRFARWNHILQVDERWGHSILFRVS